MKQLQFLGPQEFGVPPEISMDLIYKKNKLKEAYNPVEFPSRSFSHVVDALDRIRTVQSTIKKLELIYKIMMGLSTNGIFIDSDSLKGLMIYLVIQSQNSRLLVDIILCDEFTPETLKMTNRGYYLIVIYSAFEFIEQLTEDDINSLQQKWIERIRREKESGWYLPSQLLEDFISQNDILKAPFNYNIHNPTIINPEEIKEGFDWLSNISTKGRFKPSAEEKQLTLWNSEELGNKLNWGDDELICENEKLINDW